MQDKLTFKKQHVDASITFEGFDQDDELVIVHSDSDTDYEYYLTLPEAEELVKHLTNHIKHLKLKNAK